MESRRNNKNDLIKLLKKGTAEEITLFLSTVDTKRSGHKALRLYRDRQIRPLISPNTYFRISLLLIQHGADPNTKDKHGKTLLHEAAVLDPSYIPELLKLKADPCIEVGLKVSIGG